MRVVGPLQNIFRTRNSPWYNGSITQRRQHSARGVLDFPGQFDSMDGINKLDPLENRNGVPVEINFISLEPVSCRDGVSVMARRLRETTRLALAVRRHNCHK